MLDVHPTHTWRDFFLHLATITIGLLIAVGLEQTVERISGGTVREVRNSRRWWMYRRFARGRRR